MASKILLNSDEVVVCPKCKTKFPVEEGITKQVIEQHEGEYDQLVAEITEKITKDAVKTAKKNYASETEKLQKEIEEERARFRKELKEKDASIEDLKGKELSLLKEKRKLDDDKKDFELLKERELAAAKKDIEKKAAQVEAEKFELKEAGYKKELEDAKKATAELERKLERGSQQLQGEVFELELEKALRESFPYDNIMEVSKGVRGADVVHCVCTPAGQVCGIIVWEAKRAQNWSDKWLQKAKDDCAAENGDIPVIVSTKLPKGNEDKFLIVEGVWVCSERLIVPLAETLRVLLTQTNSLRLQNEGSSRKADLLYNYLGSPQFAQSLRSVFEAFEDMETDLVREKRAMNKTWKRREGHLARVAVSMSAMVGQIQSIARESLPELDKIPQLQLPGELEENDEDQEDV